MMHHKRGRPPGSRGPNCLCHGLAKKQKPNKLSAKGYGAREMRLRARAMEVS